MTPPVLLQLALVWFAAAAVGQPTQGQPSPRTPGRVAPACESYCRSFTSICSHSTAFATVEACTQTCEQWQRTSADAVSCRVSFLAPGTRSCIAAGPTSPICRG